MKNPRISAKERGLIKGSIRRVFSRSDLRRGVMEKAKIYYVNSERPRVKTWYQCAGCKGAFAGHETNIDHVLPIIAVDSSLEEMTWDEVVDRIWCDPSQLQLFCLTCHKVKSKIENKLRRQYKKEKKDGK